MLWMYWCVVQSNYPGRESDRMQDCVKCGVESAVMWLSVVDVVDASVVLVGERGGCG